MNTSINLIENKQAREELISHLEVLDKVKFIAYVTKDLIVTADQIAQYYEVDKEAISSLVRRNKEELEANGLKVLKGAELKAFKGSVQDDHTLKQFKFASQLTLFTKRAMLNVGMLLTESEVAEKVRYYLLNLEDKATDEQKTEAIEETIEQVEAKLGIKLLRKQHREDSKLVKIQAAIDRLKLYGLSKAEASYIIQKAIADKVNIDNAILDKIEAINKLETDMQRGVVREKIDYVAKNYYDSDYELVYHLMSDKMRYQIGFNMRAYRDRLKRQNVKAERGCKVEVPSYLDLIVNYKAYDKADLVINQLIDEKEELKAKKIENQKATVKAKKEAKKVKPKEIEKIPTF